MMVDSKVKPNSLLQSLMEDKTNWEDIGTITGEKPAFSQEAKDAYEKQPAAVADRAKVLKQPYVKRT
jgi:hypothetical protein